MKHFGELKAHKNATSLAAHFMHHQIEHILEIFTLIKFMIMEVLDYEFPTWGGGPPGDEGMIEIQEV